MITEIVRYTLRHNLNKHTLTAAKALKYNQVPETDNLTQGETALYTINI
jgi:hypothetical protein